MKPLYVHAMYTLTSRMHVAPARISYARTSVHSYAYTYAPLRMDYQIQRRVYAYIYLCVIRAQRVLHARTIKYARTPISHATSYIMHARPLSSDNQVESLLNAHLQVQWICRINRHFWFRFFFRIRLHRSPSNAGDTGNLKLTCSV